MWPGCVCLVAFCADALHAVLQAVDVHMELQKRGMSHANAEAYLDGGPELTFAVW